jgi:hypothetical protein
MDTTGKDITVHEYVFEVYLESSARPIVSSTFTVGMKDSVSTQEFREFANGCGGDAELENALDRKVRGYEKLMEQAISAKPGALSNVLTYSLPLEATGKNHVVQDPSACDYYYVSEEDDKESDEDQSSDEKEEGNVYKTCFELLRLDKEIKERIVTHNGEDALDKVPRCGYLYIRMNDKARNRFSDDVNMAGVDTGISDAQNIACRRIEEGLGFVDEDGKLLKNYIEGEYLFEISGCDNTRNSDCRFYLDEESSDEESSDDDEDSDKCNDDKEPKRKKQRLE